MSGKRALWPKLIAGGMLVAAVLATGFLIWLKWVDGRWLSAPDSEEFISFSFRVEPSEREKFEEFRLIVYEALPPGFPGVDVFTWSERGNIQVLGDRAKLGRGGNCALRVGAKLRTLARERGFPLRWKLAVVGKEGVLWGPRDSASFP